MANQAAIGRDVGKVDTDSGGLARYSLKLETPPGIKIGTEPELSLEYCQGTPNGSVGVGWAIGGLSCIRKGPSNMAYDEFNQRPPNYDRFKPKLSLDGAELLNVVGDYDAPGAQYSTEVEGVSRTVTVLGAGYLVLDSTGHRAEYGTTDDSRVVNMGTQVVREWRIKKSVDYHGNCITFNYVTTPRSGNLSDINTCYISSIRYTSNEKTGYQGVRIVNFEYSARPDLVVQTVQGDKCTWASLLTAVRFGIIRGDVTQVHRSYELVYGRSPNTGDSYLSTVTESAPKGDKTVKLLPSMFGYTVPGVSKDDVFKTIPQQVSNLPDTSDNVALFQMNISGRCLADLACIRYSSFTNEISIKTFLADINNSGIVAWKPSSGRGAETTLPLMDISKGFPDILCPDMNGDGRADLIVPYPDPQNRIGFSMSQSVGTGFLPAKIKSTPYEWKPNSKFMAVDLSGRGSVDILHIYSDDANKLTFRIFAGVTENGEIGLKDAVISPTAYENVGTIDWFQLNHVGTGAKSLVRVWSHTMEGTNQIQLNATTFTLKDSDNSSNGIRVVKTSVLEERAQASAVKHNVLACDINADGTQDIVLAQADYRFGKMTITLKTFIGDGFGGFTMHGEPVTKELALPAPMKEADYGNFHTTNLNGSNYPSLCYVYQERASHSYVCISIDGRSDGWFGDPVYYVLAKDLPADDMQIMAADINGNGIGDWLFYTLQGSSPTVIPIYNKSNTTDLLSWAQDPMGLKTSLSYGYMSDPNVYTSGVQWQDYNNTFKDSYPVIAAPNYVVTQLEHRNESTINSLPYKVVIKKTYAKAQINTRGRGWQGFQEINTLNATDGVLTTETYTQTWPFTGYKAQIDTKSTDGKVLLRSIKSSYDKAITSKGPWKLYRVNRLLEQTDMYHNGVVHRSNVTRYKYDQSGNMTLQASSEMQLGKPMHASWKRCNFTTIDGVTSVLTCEKISGNETNVDMTKFEPGDYSLTMYENDSKRAILKSISEWSTDTGELAKKLVEFNDYGKEIRTLNAAGLERLTTYDDVFKCFVVSVVERGPGVSSIERTAFDGATGLEVARLERTGLLTCYRIDGFGRVYECRANASKQSKNTIQANDFLFGMSIVSDSELATLLRNSYLEPLRTISFERQTSPSGAAYLATKIVSYSKEDIKGQHEHTDYLDCVKKVRRRSSRDPDDADKIWRSWDFDTRGQPIFEGYPTRVPAATDLDWKPDMSNGVKISNDGLGRPILRVRPAHVAGQYIATATTYHDGGARVQDKTFSSQNAASPLTNATQLAFLDRRYITVDKMDLIIENTDENGLRSVYEYDGIGRVVKSVDPSGQIETRTYNSHGEIVTFDSVYHNTAPAAGVAAISYKYNAANQLISRTNAAKEKISYQRDAKGRVLQKTGADGRAIKFTYDKDGFEHPSSVAIFPGGTTGAYESLVEFTYDHRGRLKDHKLTLADGSSFTTSKRYDWLDRVVHTVQPDGAMLTHDYRGAEIASSSLSNGPSSSWFIKTETIKYSPFARPEKLAVSGSGMKGNWTHEWKYDSQGFPVNHTLSNDSLALVKEDYIYNGLDQIAQRKDSLSGSTINFVYQGKRLKSSQPMNGTLSSYDYDKAGNITNKRGVAVKYQPGKIQGSKDGKPVYDVSYDSVGRVSRRITDGSDFEYLYDSMGSLKSLRDTKASLSVNISADYQGHILQRKHSDGSLDLFINANFSIHIQPDGLRKARHQLLHSDHDGSGHVLATITTDYKPADSKATNPKATNTKAAEQKIGGSAMMVAAHFADTKGNVTHTFNGEDSTLREKFVYDDFGLLDTANTQALKEDVISTFEGKYLDKTTGLMNFRGRLYDPLVGRFTTPDDILNTDSLIRTDGLNRYAFENNDPINNVDPTGHWSLSATFACIASVTLIAAGVGLTVMTGGLAAPIGAAMISGALIGGGVAGTIYTVKNSDEKDKDKFWKGFAATVALNAAIGAAAGAAGAVASPARMASGAARLAANAASGGTTSVLSKAADRGVENAFYGKHNNLFEGAAKSFLTGAVVGAAAGLYASKTANAAKDAAAKRFAANHQAPAFKLTKAALSEGTTKELAGPVMANPWSKLTSEVAKKYATSSLSPVGKIVWGVGSGKLLN